MWNKFIFGLVALGLCSPIAGAQTRSSAKTVRLQAFVAASIKIVPEQPVHSHGSLDVLARSIAEDRIEVVVTSTGQTTSPLVRIPVRVITNARTYLLRISALTEGVLGTVSADGKSLLASREQLLSANRVFALASNHRESSGEQNFIEVTLPSLVGNQHSEVRIEVQAVPQ